MIAATELTGWHFAAALSIVAAVVGIFAARDWHPRSPGDRALDAYEAQP